MRWHCWYTTVSFNISPSALPVRKHLKSMQLIPSCTTMWDHHRFPGDLRCFRVCIVFIWTLQFCFPSKTNGLDSALSQPEQATLSFQQFSFNIQKVLPNLFSRQIPSKGLISSPNSTFWCQRREKKSSAFSRLTALRGIMKIGKRFAARLCTSTKPSTNKCMTACPRNTKHISLLLSATSWNCSNSVICQTVHCSAWLAWADKGEGTSLGML